MYEIETFLNPGSPEIERDLDAFSPEADCFPLEGVVGVVSATARAREILARAEQDVHDLLSQDLLMADWTEQSGEIVARAKREISEILARDHISDAEVLEEPGTTGEVLSAQYFASLRALALPSEESGLRYQVSGPLTLATLLAFQQAVSRLPGVNSARVDPHPDDLAVLSVTTDDASLVQRQLVSMPGIHLQMDAA